MFCRLSINASIKINNATATCVKARDYFKKFIILYYCNFLFFRLNYLLSKFKLVLKLYRVKLIYDGLKLINANSFLNINLVIYLFRYCF